jgi:hypothetical protein
MYPLHNPYTLYNKLDNNLRFPGLVGYGRMFPQGTDRYNLAESTKFCGSLPILFLCGFFPIFLWGASPYPTCAVPLSPPGAPHERLGGSGAEIPIDFSSYTAASYPSFWALAKIRARTDSQWLPGIFQTVNTLVSSRATFLGRAASRNR